MIRAHTMDEHEGGSEFATITARNHIHHSCRVFDGIVPEGAGHLILREVGSQHVNHNFSMGLDESVGRLVVSRARSDTGTVKMEKRTDVTPEELLITVTSELTGQAPRVGTEHHESRDNVVVV